MATTSDDRIVSPAEVTTNRRCAIRVAGVTFIAEARTEGLRLDIQPRLRPFLVEAETADMVLGVHYEEFPADLEAEPGSQIFDSAGVWRLYERDDLYLMTFALSPHDTGPKPRPTGIATFDRTFSTGDMYVRPRGVGEAQWHPDGTVSVFPWYSPFDELLLVNRVAYLNGVHIHGCGAVLGGKGYLFTGVSGAGKSTLARLWQANGIPVLSDERLVVRGDGEQMTLHGTPWWSSAEASLAESAPLAALCFIAQSKDNYLRPLSAAEAITRLLHHCFPTFYLKVGMENTMSLLADIVSTVPAYEFGFRNDQSAIDYLREAWE